MPAEVLFLIKCRRKTDEITGRKQNPDYAVGLNLEKSPIETSFLVKYGRKKETIADNIIENKVL